ncbi:hypothetical protein HY36_11945 [Hyphomonas atlantica]|uniref:Uncharacterized protein n=2 Tax=Hyphomonas atlantica TaxID=1280948 RepID=A0A059DVZ9_9PROT|nr:hypothetical protein HY36_11945 [Hyphomonas atlantica]
MFPSYENLHDDDQLLLEVGRCLDVWSVVELNLAAIFSYLYVPTCEPPHARVAIRAPFDAVVSFDARLTMLDTAVVNSPIANSLVRERWPALSNRLSKKYKKRHEVAHFSITRTKNPDAPATLQPFSTFTAHYHEQARTPLTLANLIQRRDSFCRLADETAAYVDYLRSLQEHGEEVLAERESLAREIRGTNAQTPKDT